MSERDAEFAHGGPRQQAIHEIGVIGLLTSQAQDGADLRAIADFYLDPGSDEVARNIRTELARAEQLDMRSALEEYLNYPTMEDSATLARMRMQGRWDLTLPVEEQLTDVQDLLRQADYETHLLDRQSIDSKIVTNIAPDLTRAHGFTALRRNRCMLIAVGKHNVLEIDKTSWLALDIAALDKVNHAGAQEVRMIVIDGMLRGLPIDRYEIDQAIKAGHKLTLDDVRRNFIIAPEPHDGQWPIDGGDPQEAHEAYLKRLEDFSDEMARLDRAIDRTRFYNIPDLLIIGRHLEAPAPDRLWSFISTEFIERYIAAATPGFPYDDPKLLATAPNLLSPAATSYYVATYSHEEEVQRRVPNKYTLRNLAGFAMARRYVPGKGFDLDAERGEHFVGRFGGVDER